MSDNKYYTPSVYEFHVGFTYEVRIGKEWEERCLGTIPQLAELDDFEKRVKYLDAEDIKGQDFIIQHSSWDRESLKRTVIKYVPHPEFDSGAQFEKVINDTFVWQIFWNAETGDMIIVKAHNERKRRLVWSEPKDKKEKTPPKYFMEFDERFKGIIKNKSEFKRILRQTGIVK